jgi:hypothetical protein
MASSRRRDGDGILNLIGESAPVAIHGVHHIFHPPVLLDAWAARSPDLLNAEIILSETSNERRYKCLTFRYFVTSYRAIRFFGDRPLTPSASSAYVIVMSDWAKSSILKKI